MMPYIAKWGERLRKLLDAPTHVGRILRLLSCVYADFTNGQLALHATSLVYTTLLSIVPLLAICFSVLKGFGVHDQIRPALHEVLEPLGDRRGEIADRMVGFVDNVQVGVLGAFSLIILIYSVIALMQKIENAMNYIWRVPTGRSLARRIGDYLAVLLTGPLFIFLSVALAASVRHAPLVQKVTGIAPLVGGAADFFGKILPYLLLTLAFAFIYHFIPNTRVKFVPALIGGLVAAALWKVLGAVFAFFVGGSANYAIIYSAFAALVLFMIWLYVGWQVVLAGASVTYYLQNPGSRSLSGSAETLSLRARESMAIAACAEVARAFYNGQPPLTADLLATRAHVAPRAAADTLEDLRRAGILAATEGDGGDGYIPATPFDDVSVYDMLTRVRDMGAEAGARRGHMPGEAIEKRIDKALKQELSAVTLKSLAGKDARGHS